MDDPTDFDFDILMAEVNAELASEAAHDTFTRVQAFKFNFDAVKAKGHPIPGVMEFGEDYSQRFISEMGPRSLDFVDGASFAIALVTKLTRYGAHPLMAMEMTAAFLSGLADKALEEEPLIEAMRQALDAYVASGDEPEADALAAAVASLMEWRQSDTEEQS
jgi:hypothetical protein